MKFLKLEIENINSFVGKHTINFDALFNSSDIFAITGPTGSGKSTLLSCFSLALFGQHYKSTLSSSDFVSIGKASGAIKLTFSVATKIYEAYWECKILKKDGSKRKNITPKRILYQDGKPIDQKVESILHLDFNQFCRVVILNQGEFSKLLTSSFVERRKLLEKISNIENLKDLSTFWRQTVKVLENNIENLKLQIHTTQTISNKELKETKQNIEELKSSIPKSSKMLESLDFFYKVSNKLISHSKQTCDNEKQITNTQQQISDNQNLINKDKKILKDLVSKLEESKNCLSKMEPKLTKGIKLLTNLENITQQQKQAYVSYETSKIDLDGYIKKKEKLSQEMDSVKKEQSKIPHDILDWDDSLVETLENQLSQLKSSHQTSKSLKDFLSKLDEEVETLKDKGTSLKTSQEELSNELSLNLKVLEIKSTKELPQAEQKIFKKEQEFQSFCSQKETLSTLAKESLLEANTLREETRSLEQIHQKKGQEKEQVHQEIKKIEKIITLQQENQLLNAMLKDSIRNGHCTLCHSKEHIDLLREKIKKSNIQDATQTFDKELYSKKEKYDGLLQEESSLSQSIKNKNKQIEHLKNKESEYLEKINTINARYDEVFQTDLRKKRQLITHLGEQIFKTEQIEIQLTDFRERYSKLLSQKRSLNEQLSQSQKIYQDIINSFPVEMEKTPLPQVEELEKGFYSKKTLFKKYTESKLTLETTKKEINLFDQNIKRSQNQQTDLSQKIKDFGKRIKEIEREKKELALPSDPEHELSLLRERRENNQKEVEIQKNTIQKKELSQQTYETNLYHLQENKTLLYNQLKEIKQDILSVDLQEKDFFFDDIFQKLRLWAQTDSVLIDPLINEALNEDIEFQLETKKKALKEQEKKLTQLEEVVSIEQRQRTKAHTIQAALIKEQEKLNLYQSLSPYLEKDDFRNYILQVIEEELLWYANQQLRELADGRYQLLNPSSGGRSSEFLVEDYWFSEGVRKVSTLSGGETFLLSLGLALGMAEMTRGQAYVDCFFIDEGFGTLDQNSLDEVLDCLTTLRNTGKQIGIISHIKELTNRIPSQIKLSKSEKDYSQVQLIL